MTSKEICEILKASKGTGIKEIKVGDLVLKFDNLTKPKESLNTSTIAILNDSTGNQPFVDDIKPMGQEKATSTNTQIVDEFAMANLMVNDPEAFEKRQREL